MSAPDSCRERPTVSSQTLGSTALADYHVGEARTLTLIDPARHADQSPAAMRRRARDRFERFRRFMAWLGDPQRQLRVVHVTGTSGKGSTCAMIAAILAAAGFRVGTHTSPYLQVATEKLQIDDQLLDGSVFRADVEETLAAGERWRRATRETEPLTYGECWMALAIRRLLAERIDVAVIEVGAGGRYDLSNVVTPLACAITTVGADHLATLGPTLRDVAWHKAGIIKPDAIAAAGLSDPDLLEIIRQEAQAAGSPLLVAGETTLPPVHLGMGGAFQPSNAQMAVTITRAMAARGWNIPDEAIERGLAAARMPGRWETMPATSPRVVIDGAHNPEKAALLAATLRAERMRAGEPKPVMLLGLLGAKDAAAIVAALAPEAAAIVVTRPSVVGKPPLEPRTLAVAIRSAPFAGPIEIEPDPLAALDVAEAVARAEGANVVVAGSLYLAGAVRNRWFPSDEIVIQRTSWPRIEPAMGV
jgi:dihydrofolate synthase / folylpolyglutamate synthase